MEVICFLKAKLLYEPYLKSVTSPLIFSVFSLSVNCLASLDNLPLYERNIKSYLRESHDEDHEDDGELGQILRQHPVDHNNHGTHLKKRGVSKFFLRI